VGLGGAVRLRRNGIDDHPVPQRARTTMGMGSLFIMPVMIMSALMMMRNRHRTPTPSRR
jgi:hypothetical protein